MRDRAPARRRAVAAFRERFGGAPDLLVRAPGRVNLLGAHVDTSEGWVLPGAVDRALWLATRRRAGGRLELVADDLEAAGSVDLGALAPPLPNRPSDGLDWLDYPRGVCWVLQASGQQPCGLDCAFASDVPIGAGMSSSAALEVAFLLAFRELLELPLGRRDLALLGQRVENEYCGVASGVMDQYASLHGAADHLLELDCRTVEHRLVALPAGLAVVVADSGVRRRLAVSGFNDRRAQCAAAVERLRTVRPGLRSLRDVAANELDELLPLLPPPLDRRARHVVEECARVRRGVAALEGGDLEAFADLMRASHASSRDLYEVSLPELDVLAEAAWESEGCHGARLSGGGFGGCVVALVDRAAVAQVAERMRSAFAARYGAAPPTFTCLLADGAAGELA